MKRLLTALWILAVMVGCSPALADETHGTYVDPGGSATWLNPAVTQVAGQVEYVYCNLDPSLGMRASTATYQRLDSETQKPIEAPWGYQVWLLQPECTHLWQPKGWFGWWLVGTVTQSIGHEIAHDKGWCGDYKADSIGYGLAVRLAQTIMAYQGIRVTSYYRKAIRQGALAQAWLKGAPASYKADPISPGCLDYTGATT